MSRTIPLAFLERIPKTDLHVHLDGSLRIPTLIELAREAGVSLPSETEAGLRERVFKESYADLMEYLQGFQYTVAVMQTPAALERVAYELACDNLAEGVRYIEVRFAPQLHMHDGMDMEEVIRAVSTGLERARDEHNQTPGVAACEDIPFAFGIIVCALRWFHGDMSDYYRKLHQVMPYSPPRSLFAAASLELARAGCQLAREQGLPVVGFDLAGAEAGNPAVDHHEAFSLAHRNFLPKTVHAGEAYGPESIFQALTECHANRIGHGTFLFAPERIQDPSIPDKEKYVDLLVNYVANQRICIEVNLTSNLQTLPEMESVAEHPLRQMLEHKLSATICTDNRLVSNTSVTRELDLAVEHLPIDTHRLRNLVIAGFKGSFFPGSYIDKRAYVRKAIDRYEAVEREFGL